MPRFEFKSPDGRVIALDGPEGATEEQAFQIVQQMEAARAERIAAATAADQARIRGEFQDSMSTLDRVLIGAGRGFTDLGQGVKQLGLNAGAAVGLVDDKTAEDYNADVREEAAMYERDLGDSTAANIGRYGAQFLATLPAGGAGAGYVTAGKTLGSQLLRAGAVGAASGGLTSGLNAVTEEGDYWGQKAQQVGTGAVFGGVAGAGGQSIVRGLQGAVNAPRAGINAVADIASPQSPQSYEIAIKLAQEAGDTARVEQLQQAMQQAVSGQGGVLSRFLRGSVAQQRKADQVARGSGIDLSPGQRSGNPAAMQLENAARQSFFTRWQMFKADFARGRQMVNEIRRIGRDIGGANVSPETFAQQLQGTVKNMVTGLANRRTEVAGGAYREVERIAGGAPIVQARNTLDEVANILKDFGDLSTDDGKRIAGWAEGFFARLSGDGMMTPTKAIRELQGWSQAGRTGVGLFDGVADRSTAKTAANRLARALQADLDETAAGADGSVGDALKQANDLWRRYSSEIDAVEASALGRIIGDDMVGELTGTSFNTTSAKRVLDVLDGLSAPELQVVKDYLGRANPQLWQQFQRTTLDRAAAAARAAAPSMGKRPLPINPVALVRQLEGSSGQAAVNQAKRLEVIFEGNVGERVRNLLDAGRRMSDLTGYNHSGSGVYQETTGLVQGLLNPVKQGASTVLGLGTLNAVARGAQPGAARVPLRMLEAPQWATAAALTPAAAIGAAGSRELMDRPPSEQEALSLALAEYQRQQAGRSR